MAKYDLIIRGGQVVFPDDILTADIAVKDEKIAAIARPGELGDAASVIDATGLTVLAGIIDPHVHMRDPGSNDREDFITGTMSAAAGGVTTVLDHPNTIPSISCVENLHAKRDLLSGRSHVDFGLYGAAGAGNLEDIAKLAEAGAVAFKTFLHGAPAGREQEFVGLCATDDGELYSVLTTIAKTGLMSIIHAENDSIINSLIAKLKSEGDILGDAHERSRPVATEMEAVGRVAILGEAVGARVNVAHLSSGSAAAMIRMFRDNGYSLTVETCPQYLFATVESLNKYGPYAKINPPLRSQEEQDLLWEHVRKGTIDMIGSDHAPHRPADKEKGKEDIFTAGSGLPGIETMLPLFLTAVNQGKLDLNRLTRIMSLNSARNYGLYPRKGVIRPGSDADFVLVDLEQSYRFEKEKLYTKQREQALLFDGFEAKGCPVMTIIRGHKVMEKGKILVEPGFGKYLTGPRYRG